MILPHPLINYNQKVATAESNLADIGAIRQMKAGLEREDLINTMIESNIPLVFLKVDTYIKLYPNFKFLYDDLVSAGFFALTQAVNLLSKLETPEDGGNPTAYISNRIVWGIGRFIDNEIKQQIPHEFAIGCQLPARSIVPGGSLMVGLQINPMSIVDIRDLLDHICQTPEDRIIITMRERGCTDEEIAKSLDISRSAVCVQRHELMKRYEDLIDNTK